MRLANFLLLVFLIISCKSDKNPSNNPILSILVGAQTPYSPVITSISPQIGNPVFTAGLETFAATEVTINGRNFVQGLSSNSLTFYNTQGTSSVAAGITYADTTKIVAKVPNGAVSGFVTVTNNGGACTSLDRKSGPNCTSTNFYVSCYQPYLNRYGEENRIDNLKQTDFEFTSNTTLAFRTDFPGTGSNTVQIICIKSPVLVKYFSPSCSSTDVISNGSTIVFNPTFSVTGPYTVQYFVTAQKGTCTFKTNLP
jgi:uncharacterized protein YggT (Ycf19 family)